MTNQELEDKLDELKLWLDTNYPTKYSALRGDTADRPEAPTKPTVFTDEEEKKVYFWAYDRWISLEGEVLSDEDGNTKVGTEALESLDLGSKNTAVGYNSLIKNTNGHGNTAVGYDSLTEIVTTYDVDGIVVKEGSENTAIGSEALKVSTTSGSTAVGYKALTSNTGGLRNTAIGRNALSVNKHGSSNTAVGNEALKNNTADDCTAVGSEALLENTSGAGNTAVGFEGLTANVDGRQNTAVGFRALSENVSGEYNTAVGHSALLKTTGVRNSALGQSALRGNVDGERNQAIGYNALYYNTSGSYNTAIGAYSQYQHKTGERNISIGEYSLNKNVSQSDNVAIGCEAARYNLGKQNVSIGNYSLTNATGGTYNTSVGHNSLLNVSTGDSNTAVGHAAGDNLEIGNYNIVLGYNADVPETNSNYSCTLGSGITNLRCDDWTFSSTSDERDKINIIDSTLGLDYINKLRPVEYEWNYRKEHYTDGVAPPKQGTKAFGFIAQELKKAQDEADAPHLSTYHHYPAEFDKDGNALEGKFGIDIMEADYVKLFPVVIQAVKDLSEKVEKLERSFLKRMLNKFF